MISVSPKGCSSSGFFASGGERKALWCSASDRQPGDWGPRRVSQAEIEASFTDGLRVDSIDAAKIDVTIDPAGAQAWLVTATRT